MTISSLDTNTFLGPEFIQRAALFHLFDNLNDALAEIETTMQLYDTEFDTRLSRTTDITVVELIAEENFYEGHRPSLIKAPIDKYPNCAVMVARATPAPDNALFDQQDSFSEVLSVEIMVKSQSSEDEVDRRCKRTVEAVHLTMKRDQTLGGAITGFDSPSVIFGDVFTRKERTAYGDEWFWQGARLEYPVRKNAPSVDSQQGALFADNDQG